MNYAKIYEQLCTRARTQKPCGYVEKHRILPGCMGGKYVSDNIAYLTPEEHFVAHQLLAKIYPHDRRLALALLFMTAKSKHHIRNNKTFGWIRRKANEALKGRKNTLEARQRMSEAAKKRWQAEIRQHKPRSLETKKNMSEAAKKRWSTADKLSHSEKVKTSHALRSEEARQITNAKIKASYPREGWNNGREHSPETRAKIGLASGAARLGKKRGPYRKKEISSVR